MNCSDLLIDPELDLSFERTVDLSPQQIWDAWTKPEHLLHWFTPEPWKTVDCEIELFPGGIFRTTMRSPEGEDFPNIGCFLEVLPPRRLVWTNALLPEFRPVEAAECGGDNFLFTAIIAIEPYEKSAKYRATVIHSTVEGCRKHKEMGFEQGWAKALDQLVTHMKQVG